MDISEIIKKHLEESNALNLLPSQSFVRKPTNWERRKHDIQFVLKNLLRKRLGEAIRGKRTNINVIKHLGCTVPELIKHLEGKFKKGMTWENRGLKGWHIDHVIPLTAFDLTNDEEFKRACHYTNLQPMWAIANIKKGGAKRYHKNGSTGPHPNPRAFHQSQEDSYLPHLAYQS